MSRDKKAVMIQEATGIRYQSCLALVRGELSFDPQSANCDVKYALAFLDIEPAAAGCVHRRCVCAKCAAGARALAKAAPP